MENNMNNSRNSKNLNGKTEKPSKSKFPKNCIQPKIGKKCFWLVALDSLTCSLCVYSYTEMDEDKHGEKLSLMNVEDLLLHFGLNSSNANWMIQEGRLNINTNTQIFK